MSRLQRANSVEEETVNDMDSPEDMIAGYRRFRANTYRRQVTLYRDLGMGQSPKIMLVACADSRADPSSIFDAAPGQLFVVRNVANLIPPYHANSSGKHGVSAALEYAVTVLKVQHVVVMGHGGCGGVSASLAGGDCGEFIGPWVRMLDKVRTSCRARSRKSATLVAHSPHRSRARFSSSSSPSSSFPLFGWPPGWMPSLVDSFSHAPWVWRGTGARPRGDERVMEPSVCAGARGH